MINRHNFAGYLEMINRLEAENAYLKNSLNKLQTNIAIQTAIASRLHRQAIAEGRGKQTYDVTVYSSMLSTLINLSGNQLQVAPP